MYLGSGPATSTDAVHDGTLLLDLTGIVLGIRWILPTVHYDARPAEDRGDILDQKYWLGLVPAGKSSSLYASVLQRVPQT
ncbi:hypothetical protein Y032_0076g1041 [Ancylostoma ceylanicum]|uniref:Uncharacterized protein n=1 Tax=Ancylostoma ceylanicum TaxID=53326 RepID=A0A016TUC3_9BILA|nr:hypothetical protein Y032_0076g1041 [Ancylostoma ceylanicum]